jgi:hypothetical protein
MIPDRLFVRVLGFVFLLLTPAFVPKSHSQNNSAQYTQIVKRISLTGQVGGLPLTTLFTPTVTGLYRLSGYSITTTPDPNTSSSILEDLFWFDGTNFQSAGPGNLCLANTHCITSFTNVIYAQEGQPVSGELILSGSSTNAVYSFFVSVEKL